MKAGALKLERFDPPAHAAAVSGESVLLQRARAEAYAEGYAAGQAAAGTRADDHARRAAPLLASLEAAIAAAPGRATAEAGGALKVLLEALFPALSAKGFAAEAASAFAQAAQAANRGAIEIIAPRDQAAALKEWLAALAPEADIAVRADAAVSSAQARAIWPGGGVDFDLDAALSGALDAFEKALQSLASEKQQ